MSKGGRELLNQFLAVFIFSIKGQMSQFKKKFSNENLQKFGQTLFATYSFKTSVKLIYSDKILGTNEISPSTFFPINYPQQQTQLERQDAIHRADFDLKKLPVLFRKVVHNREIEHSYWIVEGEQINWGALQISLDIITQYFPERK